MKFKSILLAFIVLNTFATATANELALKNCANDSLNYGNGRGKDTISMTCYKAFKERVNHKTSKLTSDEKRLILGYSNTIFIENMDKTKKVLNTNIIAGKSTGLKSIVALSIDEVNNEIIVLEQSGDILFFSSILTGNVAPFRVLRNKELHGSTNILIDPIRGHVITYNKSLGEFKIFSRKANFYGRDGKKKLEVLSTIKATKVNNSDLSIEEDSDLLIHKDLKNNSYLKYQIR